MKNIKKIFLIIIAGITLSSFAAFGDEDITLVFDNRSDHPMQINGMDKYNCEVLDSKGMTPLVQISIPEHTMFFATVRIVSRVNDARIHYLISNAWGESNFIKKGGLWTVSGEIEGRNVFHTKEFIIDPNSIDPVISNPPIALLVIVNGDYTR